MNYENLKALVNAKVYENTEQEITGEGLNEVLQSIVASLKKGYQFVGIATPTTNPGTPDQNVFYIASESGTYSNFGGLAVSDGEVAIFKYNGTWTKEVTGAATAAQVTQLGPKVDGAIEHSKNLADYAEVIDGYVDSSGKYFSVTSGEKSILFPCEPNTYYTISKILSSRFRVACFSVRPIGGTSGTGTITDNTATAITIATGQDSVYIVAFVYNGTGESVSMSDIVASLQIEKGTQATEYIKPGWSAIDKVARKDIDNLDLRVQENETQIEELANSPSAIALKAINYGYKEPMVVNGADVTDMTAWSTGNGATLALGKAYNNITRMSRKVMTITSTSGNGRAFCNLDTPVNSNLNALLFEFCINYPDSTVPGNVVIELWSGTIRDAAHKRSITFQLSGNNVFYRNGWHQACIFFSSAKSFIVNGTSFDETAVTAVGLQLNNTNGVAYSVSVARMDFVPAMKKPGIVTVVDNFGVSVPAMADYAHSKGVRLNLSIVPGAYTGAPGAPVCATKAELDRIASQGHCIWNHTYTHQVLNNLTFAQIQDQINLAEQWMEENGYGKNCDFLSIPSASFNTETSDAVFESNVRTIFHNWCYNNQMVYVPYGPVMRTLPVTLLDSFARQEGKTPADIASVAAKCVTYNGLAVIGFHGTYWELDNGDSWKAYIDAIAELGVYHYGIDELVAGRWC